MEISYEWVWQAKEWAFSLTRGSLRESFCLLLRYGEALKIANPVTQYELESDPDRHFKCIGT